MIEEDYIPEEPAEIAVEPESEPAPVESESEPSAAVEPEESSAPVEVITVDELLDRLTQAGQADDSEVDEAPIDSESEEARTPQMFDLIEDVVEEPVEILTMHEMLERLTSIDKTTVQMDKQLETMDEQMETIEQTLFHPLMETSFQDYTVTEGLLLLLLLCFFITACAKILKGGFSWLQ